MRIAYFDCYSGISGDMCLGALIGAGWSQEALESLPSRLELDGVRITVGEARRKAFVARRVEVDVTGQQPHRHLHHIAEMLERGRLEPAIRARALQVFRRLAEAEAEVHGSTAEKVHFHEVGAADALVDIVGTLEGLAALGVERVYASTLRLGRGSVSSQHGPIPVPAPATTLLLRGAPVEIPDVDVELVTPTGAALLATLVEDWGPPPPFRLDVVGAGAGGRDLAEQANVLRVLIGDAEGAPLARRRVAVLETAIDDDSPQVLGAMLPRLLAAGALDAMLVPATMKKGRPGLWLIVIALPDHVDALARLVLAETSSLGVRVRMDERFELERRVENVDTPFGAVAVKVARLPEGDERMAPEFESVRAAAERTGRSVREVAEAARSAWSRRRG